MGAPELWGYDPDALYLFVPSEFQQDPEGMEDAYRAALEANEAKEADSRETVEAIAKRVVESFKDAPRKAKDGAPVFHLAPLSEKTSLRLQAARTAFQATKREVERRFRADLGRFRGLPEAERIEKVREAEDLHTLKASERANGVFPVELQAQVLAEAVRGWENIRKPFTGAWDVDGRVLKASWKAEIFWALVNETAFTEEAMQGFLSRQASQAA